MRLLFVAVLVLLGSCSSRQPASTSATEVSKTGPEKTAPLANRRQFENQIAESILRDVREAFPQEHGPARVKMLQKKLAQFDRGVDADLLSSRMRLEKEVLAYLANSEDVLVHSGSFASTLKALSSLDWEPHTYEEKTLEELNRIDQTIAVLAGAEDPASSKQSVHMSQIRNAAKYPEDNFNGRQAYLDRLSQEMINAQADWFDTYTTYNPSELSILGEEGTNRSFYYTADGLVINLDQVTDLPAFELKSLAVFYGFPGLQSFIPRPEDSLRSLVNLPAYTHGWAGYLLDEIGTRDLGNTLGYLYFARLQASMALADLRIHSDKWSPDEALKYITTHTPYTSHRITLMMEQLQQKPGHYAAALGGKLMFSELNSRCLAEGKSCESDFNQQVIDQGPIPFVTLERLIF